MATARAEGIDSKKIYEYDTKVIGVGGMKEVYFTTDGKFAVALYKKVITPQNQIKDEARLRKLVGELRNSVFTTDHGGFWSERLCWPIDLVKSGDRMGLVVPKYPAKYFFTYGLKNITAGKGKEKNAKWFASQYNRRLLDERELGNWSNYLDVALNLSRAVRRMHAAGVAHSDLSFNNVLIDPLSGSAIVIDLDGLVIRDWLPPQVAGTRGFIAPEVIMNQAQPSKETDLHALAVMIYQYLFIRHPLEGGARYDDNDADNQSHLEFGERALFIEHPTDKRNRVNIKWLDAEDRFWGNPEESPMSIAGPYLEQLFLKSFVDGLHNPRQRATADEWESALAKTRDLLIQCTNTKCQLKWIVYTQKTSKCPFCGTSIKSNPPVFQSERKFDGKNFTSEDYRIVLRNGMRLYSWHFDITKRPNEKLSLIDKSPLVQIEYRGSKWIVKNLNLPGLRIASSPTHEFTDLSKDSEVELTPGMTLQANDESTWRRFVTYIF